MCGYCGRALTPSDRGGYSCPRCDPILRTIGQDLNLDTRAGLDRWRVVWGQFLREAARSLPAQELAGQGVLL